MRRANGRGLNNMKIQAYLTAAAMSLVRLTAALLAIQSIIWTNRIDAQGLLRAHHTQAVWNELVAVATAWRGTRRVAKL